MTPGSKPPERPVLRLHLWLETQEGVFFGHGRLMLLEKIEECGSLQAAAKALGMSYRAAWGKVKTTEKILGFQLIEKRGGNRRGYQLSEFARILMDGYRRWQDDVEQLALLLAKQHLPCDPVAWSERHGPGEGPSTRPD